MCGRYYVDDETAREIERMVDHLDSNRINVKQGDVYPSNTAVVINKNHEDLSAEVMKWGFPGYEKNQLLINARAESILEKKTFRESILNRRCVIPAKGFYEWNSHKEKYKFERPDQQKMLYMAGCFKQDQEYSCFVIITTAANESVAPVHNRMPLILEKEEIEGWVKDNDAIDFFLHKPPVLLERKTEYEQMSLFL